MKAVVTLSKAFPAYHPQKGRPTNFKEKTIQGSKIHTCRKNYKYWEERIAKVQSEGGVLSVREWIGQPYKQPGQATIKDIPADVVGVQRLRLTRTKAAYAEVYGWTATVNGYYIPITTLAGNDGLTEEEFKAWFAPHFDEDNRTVDFAIIHFTKERY